MNIILKNILFNQIQNLNDYFINNNQRWEWEDLFIYLCKVISYRSSCAKTRQAALLVKDNRIISMGVNGPRSKDINCIFDGGEEVCGKDASGSCIRAIHCETNALGYASRNGINTEETTIYVTMSPCLSCAKLLVASGIKEYVYIDEYRLTEGKEFLERAGVIVRKYDNK